MFQPIVFMIKTWQSGVNGLTAWAVILISGLGFAQLLEFHGPVTLQHLGNKVSQVLAMISYIQFHRLTHFTFYSILV